MDTNLSFFSLSFGEDFANTESPEISYKVENVDSIQDTSDFVSSLDLSSNVLGDLERPSDDFSELLKNDPCVKDGEFTAQCDICGKEFKKKKAYYGHLRIHSKDKSWSCERCPDLKFNTKYQWMRHWSEHTGLTRCFACSLCPMTFDKPSALKYHVLSKHENNKPHECDECEMAFYKASDLRKHKDKHRGKKMFKCPECDKRFTDVSNLNRHILLHTKAQPHSCAFCGQKFQQMASLRRHTERRHPSVAISEKNKVRQYHCTQCSATFDVKIKLKEHIEGEHNSHKPIEEPVDTPPIQNTSDLGKNVDALIYDILCGENVAPEDIKVNTNNNNVETKTTQEKPIMNDIFASDANAEKLLQFDLIEEMNQIHGFTNNEANENFMQNDLFDGKIDGLLDFDNFNVNADLTDLTSSIDKNTEFVDDDIIDSWCHNKTDKLPEDILNMAMEQTNIREEDALVENENTSIKNIEKQVNECATIFESDIDLEASTNLAENLNQLIGENHVEYIENENDDTFVIVLNNTIDAEKLTDILNYGLNSLSNEKESKGNDDEESKEESKVKKKRKLLPMLYTCNLCQKIFKKKDNYNSHMAGHNPKAASHRCVVCKKKFAWRSTHNKHMLKYHIPAVTTAHKCDQCDKTYKAAWQLREHKERDHQKITKYKCKKEDCDRKFYKKVDLDIHSRQHSQERSYVCKICDKGFLYSSHLRRHQKKVDCGNPKIKYIYYTKEADGANKILYQTKRMNAESIKELLNRISKEGKIIRC